MPNRRRLTKALRRRSTTTRGLRALRGRAAPVALRASPRAGAIPFQALLLEDTPIAEKIRAIRSGVRARVIDDMAQYLDVPKTVVFDVLQTPESTAHRLISDNRPLGSAASERVVRVADLIRVAQETFGGREAATRWLKTANLALGNATPLSMLDTESGGNEVRRILSAIKHGGAF